MRLDELKLAISELEETDYRNLRDWIAEQDKERKSLDTIQDSTLGKLISEEPICGLGIS